MSNISRFDPIRDMITMRQAVDRMLGDAFVRGAESRGTGAWLEARGELGTAAQVLGERLYSLLSPLEVLFLVEQGEVAERLGDRRTAVQAYRRVVSTWARADPSLQAFVAKASRALERMGAGSELVIATSSAR